MLPQRLPTGLFRRGGPRPPALLPIALLGFSSFDSASYVGLGAVLIEDRRPQRKCLSSSFRDDLAALFQGPWSAIGDDDGEQHHEDQRTPRLRSFAVHEMCV